MGIVSCVVFIAEDYLNILTGIFLFTSKQTKHSLENVEVLNIEKKTVNWTKVHGSFLSYCKEKRNP